MKHTPLIRKHSCCCIGFYQAIWPNEASLNYIFQVYGKTNIPHNAYVSFQESWPAAGTMLPPGNSLPQDQEPCSIAIYFQESWRVTGPVAAMP